LTGFKAGIALVTVVDQVPKLLGVHIAKAGFLRDALAVLHAIPQASVPTLVVGLVMIALLIEIEILLPRALAPLIVVAAGLAGVSLFGLQGQGVAIVGHIPQGLPSVTLPDFSLAMQPWPAAAGANPWSAALARAPSHSMMKRPPAHALKGVRLAGRAAILRAGVHDRDASE
jgi:SulP family sulfate permease